MEQQNKQKPSFVQGGEIISLGSSVSISPILLLIIA
jgi:hypothetical protein